MLAPALPQPLIQSGSGPGRMARRNAWVYVLIWSACTGGMHFYGYKKVIQKEIEEPRLYMLFPFRFVLFLLYFTGVVSFGMYTWLVYSDPGIARFKKQDMNRAANPNKNEAGIKEERNFSGSRVVNEKRDSKTAKYRGPCRTCHHERELRTKHCKDCNECIEFMDHHCIWIDNCIGKGNHRMFLCYITVQTLHLLVALYLMIEKVYYFSQHPLEAARMHGLPKVNPFQSNINKKVDRMLVDVLPLEKLIGFLLSMYTHAGIFIFTLVVAIIFLVVGSLLFNQLDGISRNMLGNEDYNFHRYDHFKDGFNPFDFGFRQNWIDFCATNRTMKRNECRVHGKKE